MTVVVRGPKDTFAISSRISDDGRFVAYGSNVDGRSVVHVIGTEPEARPRTLVDQAGTGALAADWSPDGRTLLVLLMRYASPGDMAADTPTALELALVEVASGSVSVLARFEGWHERASLFQARFSPDGRHIAYMRQPSKGSRDRYVELLDLSGGTSTLVGTAAYRIWPRWSSDGGTLLYREGPFARESLWAVPVQAGRVAGQPVRLGTDVCRARSGDCPLERCCGLVGSRASTMRSYRTVAPQRAATSRS